MLKVVLVLIALIACANCIPVKPVKPVASDVPCDVCLQLMDEGLNILLNEIANGGIIGGCAELCHVIPNTVLDFACDLLCDFVGIKEFVKIINETDPDPIWYCQELHACPKVDGGAVTMTSITCAPTSGAIGTTFKVQSLYTVVNATGPGYIVVTLNPPDNGEPQSDAQVSFGEAPGSYDIELDITTDSNFTTGVYGVQVQICEGDCLNKHPYSGIYAQGTTNFTITN